MNITISINNEITALWLSELFKTEAEEAKGASSNEHMFALGSDGENSEQHEEQAEQNREYSELLQKAYDDIQKYWSK